MLQTFALGLIGMQITSSGTGEGISARALALDALALILRLSSTVWLDGYLPVDASGDWVYQATDVCSLALALWLLYQILVVYKSSYQCADDSFPAVSVAVGSILLAALLHCDMNDYPLFDITWMASLFIGVMAALPQLWLIIRNGGKVEALTSHYIAAMAISRVLSGVFMWYARQDITCKPWIQGVNHGIWTILGAHLLHLILLGDFAYYYGMALARGKIAQRIDFSQELWV